MLATQSPPEPRFWQRYSPRHEAPISGAGSLLVHAGLAALIVLLALGVMSLRPTISPLPVRAVVRDPGPRLPVDDLAALPRLGNNPAIEDPGADPIGPAFGGRGEDPAPRGEIAAARPVDPVARPNERALGQPKPGDLLDLLERGTRVKGSPRGAPNGSSVSEGPGPLAPVTVDRMRRWTILFDRAAYVAQLHALGAYLWIPTPGTNPPRYRLIRDLRRQPVSLLDDDGAAHNRIRWLDDQPDSVRAVLVELRLDPAIDHFVVLFPAALESKLAQLERQYRNRHESEIETTHFRIHRASTGYEPVVVAQTLKMR